MLILLACAPPPTMDETGSPLDSAPQALAPDPDWSDLQLAAAIVLRDCEATFRTTLDAAERDSRDEAACPEREEDRDWLRLEADGCSSLLDTVFYAGALEAQNVRTSSTLHDPERESRIDADGFSMQGDERISIDGWIVASAVDGDSWTELHNAECSVGAEAYGVTGTYVCSTSGCSLQPGAIAHLPTGQVSIAGSYVERGPDALAQVRLKGVDDIQFEFPGFEDGCLDVQVNGDPRRICPD